MSPIIARTAAQAGLRLAGRRQFSLMTSLRQLGRSMEHAPFERLPKTQTPAPADWSRQIKRVSSQAVIFVPGIATLLGWPFAASMVLDGHVGQF